jgi:hypothetical protein
LGGPYALQKDSSLQSVSLMFKPDTVIIALCCLLSACSGLKAYRSDHEANLFISTDTENLGWLSDVDTTLDIYQMHDDCDVNYQGTVNLGDSLVEVGVPAGVAAYLVFRVESSAFLTNTYSSMGYDVAFYPDFGHVYDVNVIYRDNIYDVEVQERPRGDNEGQWLALGMVERVCGSEI